MPLAVRLGRITGFVDRPLPGGLKIHTAPVSVLGGPAVIVAALVGLGFDNGLSPGLLTGVGLAVTIGLADDVRSLPPWPRVVSTGVAGGIAALGPLSGGDVLPVVTGVILGMACTNAVNIVDGQDRLAGGLALIASVSMAVAADVLGLPSAVFALGLATAAGTPRVPHLEPATRPSLLGQRRRVRGRHAAGRAGGRALDLWGEGLHGGRPQPRAVRVRARPHDGAAEDRSYIAGGG